MNTTAAQRIRFGILAARHVMERDRLTPWQIDYLEGCETAGWVIGDAQRAYDREAWAVLHRERERVKSVECEECGRKGNEGFVWFQGEIMLCANEAACRERQRNR